MSPIKNQDQPVQRVKLERFHVTEACGGIPTGAKYYRVKALPPEGESE